jgi:hypothetical protein
MPTQYVWNSRQECGAERSTLSNGKSEWKNERCMHADRKTAGRSDGHVTVNGFDKQPSSFARVMGYCEQFDIHSPGLTIAESVRLSALLRLSSDVDPSDVRPLSPLT